MTPYFSSFNLNNILIWNPPEISKDFRYTVQYRKYGKPWQRKIECRNIVLTRCDLTNETHTDEEYFGRVILKNKNCTHSFKTNKFSPRTDTIFGPPTINLIAGDTSIKIKLTHPFKSRSDIYKDLTYHIYLNDIRVIETEEPYYEIKNIDPNTTYCIASELHWLHKSSNLSDKTCITTNADHTSQNTIERMMYVLLGTLIFCIVTALGCAIHVYIYGGNLKQPTILNITTSKSKNAISVDAHRVTINVISMESGKDTILAAKEEDKEFQNPTDLNITDGEDYISYDSGITEETSEKSVEDYGYVSLQEQKTIARPTISPYDMPHQPPETIPLISTSTDIVCEEKDFYGYCKSNAIVSPVHGNDDLDDVPNGSEETMANNFYIPQGDSDSTKKARLIEELCEPKESYTEQELFSTINVISDTGSNESTMLFVDWRPDDPPLYISNLSKKRELENCIKKCQEEKECLLSQLYLPREVTEATNDNQLGQLEERWGLFVQNAEK